MTLHPYMAFNKTNRCQLLLLIAGHTLWSLAVFVLTMCGQRLEPGHPWWFSAFIALQLYAAAQLLLPALRLHPEARTRGFYLFWGVTLALSLWLVNLLPAEGVWQQLLTALKSGLLLLIATVTAGALARYVHRLWEIVPICIVMTLADFASWRYGPTATFTEQIQQYQLTPEGPPPLVDMILIKFALPGTAGLAPLFGISDWIMVVFFAIVARRFAAKDNLICSSGEAQTGLYLPVSVAALFVAIILAQTTGLFIPALPLIALIMLLWYATHYLIQLRSESPQRRNNKDATHHE